MPLARIIRARTHDQKNDCFLSWNDKWWLWLCQRRLSSCSGSPASCMRGNLPLAPLCPLPARLPYQHSFASTEGGVESRGRSSIDGNPRRQAKDPAVTYAVVSYSAESQDTSRGHAPDYQNITLQVMSLRYSARHLQLLYIPGWLVTRNLCCDLHNIIYDVRCY